MSIPLPKQGIEVLIIANIMRRPFVMMIKEKLGFVKNWEGQEHIVCGSDDKPSLFEVERGSVASTVGLCGQEGSPKMEACEPAIAVGVHEVAGKRSRRTGPVEPEVSRTGFLPYATIESAGSLKSQASVRMDYTCFAARTCSRNVARQAECDIIADERVSTCRSGLNV